MESQTPPEDERRRAHRLQLRLPVQARVGEGEYRDLEVLDIGIGGMQIHSPDLESIKEDFDSQHNRAQFEIRIVAHLAWAQPDGEGGFLTGWEFDADDGEERMG